MVERLVKDGKENNGVAGREVMIHVLGRHDFGTMAHDGEFQRSFRVEPKFFEIRWLDWGAH